MIGNTGFVGLAIAPTLVDKTYLSWIVFYNVANNILLTTVTLLLAIPLWLVLFG